MPFAIRIHQTSAPDVMRWEEIAVGDPAPGEARIRHAAVYDDVGKDTFMASLDSLRPRGTMVSFGNASGPVAPFDPILLP